MRITHAAVAAVLALVTASCATSSPRTTAAPPESFTVPTPLPAPIVELRKAFRPRYDEAIKTHLESLRSSYPIVTQDLLNMTLLRPGGPPVRFSMKTGTYFLMAHTAHPPLTVYSILSAHGFGPLSDAASRQLSEYAAVLAPAAEQIRAMQLPPATATGLTTILESTRQYIAESIARKSTSKADFVAYVRPLRELIGENLRTGANEQLAQFRDQMNAWRSQFPDEQWSELRVVVLGFHQARELYAVKSYFQWLLHEPEYENRVVYAEFQSPISGDGREAAEIEALKLLTKVDFDHGAGELIFGDATLLQRDVMGPAALQILKQWGEPTWP